jgi:hypothetical protein
VFEQQDCSWFEAIVVEMEDRSNKGEDASHGETPVAFAFSAPEMAARGAEATPNPGAIFKETLQPG